MNKKLLLTFGIILFAILLWTTKSNAATINTQKIDLYVLNEKEKSAYNLTIPKEYPQSYTIKVSGNKSKPTFSVAGGNQAISVDSNGVVKPVLRQIKYVSMNGGESTVREEYETGEFKVNVAVDGQNFVVKVNVLNYTHTHAQKIMDDYIKNNIKSSMTEMQNLQQICKFVASFDYSTSASGTTSMILCDGGDCWASTSTIVTMCEKVGLYAHARYAVNDYGAGSGHRNAVVYVDGKCYIVEAGYAEKAPRMYTIVPEEGGFLFESKNDGTYKLVQYDGRETNVTVPSTYMGKPVTEIGERAFYYSGRFSGVKIKSVKLPNTITSIGNSAFFDCEELTSVNIPNSVKEMGISVFSLSKKLKLQIDGAQPYFTVSEGVLYNKNKTKALCCLASTNGTVVLPDSVTEIADAAFYYSDITNIVLNKNLKTIGVAAFSDSKIREITIPKSVTNIKTNAFAFSVLNCIIEKGSKVKMDDGVFYGITELHLPDSITEFNSKFARLTTDLTVYGNEGAYAQKFAKANNFKFAVESKLGDVNQDGKINTKDARLVLQYYVGTQTLTSMQKKLADVNQDGKINTKDGRQILLYYIGKIKNF